MEDVLERYWIDDVTGRSAVFPGADGLRMGTASMLFLAANYNLLVSFK